MDSLVSFFIANQLPFWIFLKLFNIILWVFMVIYVLTAQLDDSVRIILGNDNFKRTFLR